MKTMLKSNPVSIGYYLIVAVILVAFFQFTFSNICQIVDWLSATVPSFLTASQKH